MGKFGTHWSMQETSACLLNGSWAGNVSFCLCRLLPCKQVVVGCSGAACPSAGWATVLHRPQPSARWAKAVTWKHSWGAVPSLDSRCQSRALERNVCKKREASHGQQDLLAHFSQPPQVCNRFSFNDPKCYYKWERSRKCLVLYAHWHEMVSWWSCSTEKSLLEAIGNRECSGQGGTFGSWGQTAPWGTVLRWHLGGILSVRLWLLCFLMSSCLGKYSSILGAKSSSEIGADYLVITAEGACSCSAA